MLTRLQIKAINRVRELLRSLQAIADRRNRENESYELGKFSEAAYQAENALFNVINIDEVYLDGEQEVPDVDIADEDLGEIPLTT